MICLVFDITNKESFGHTKFWYEKVNEILKANNKKIIGSINLKFYFIQILIDIS